MALSLDGTTGISATGNIYGNNVIATGSLTAGTFSPTSVSASGNVTGSNILTAGLVSATGNITGGNILGGANVNATTHTGTTVSVTANVTGGNILTAGLISATGAITGAALTGTSLTVSTGNITGGNLLLSGAIIDSAQLDIQTSAANANIALAPNGTGMVTVSTQISVVGNILTGGFISATGNLRGGNLLTGGSISAGGNIRIDGLISATGAITGAALTGTSLTVSTGNVSCGNIVNTNANGVGNIGSTGTRFNQVFALASSAQYADLAEKYTADATYETGTVVAFGGAEEVTISAVDSDRRVAGVISALPSFRMNDGLQSQHTAMVALTGRVPTLVTGTVRKGDMMVSAGAGRARVEANPAIGTVIGKALEYHDCSDGVIEVVVGRV
jgi:hypothetical protein